MLRSKRRILLPDLGKSTQTITCPLFSLSMLVIEIISAYLQRYLSGIRAKYSTQYDVIIKADTNRERQHTTDPI